MRVLVADKFEQSGIDGLRDAGCEVTHEPALVDQALVDAIAEHKPEVLIVRSTKVPAAALQAGPLKLVVRAGAGYNTIDVATASELGIYVANCPGKNSIAVAELAMGLIYALDRRIPDGVADLRAGVWNKGEYGKAKGLYGRTLGLIGVGGIGSEMIPRATGMGMPVIAWSRSLTPEKAKALGVQFAESPGEVAAKADIVSVHLALNDNTRGMFGAEFFNQMKDGAFFINTSRGEVVDEEALAAAVQNKKLRVGLDVFANEPSGGKGEFAPAIVSLPGVYGTHHVGASTDQAQEAIADEAVRIVKVFMETGGVPNVVNMAKQTPATKSVQVRHKDAPGTLAHTLTVLRQAGFNVQEMENNVFAGAKAAMAKISIEGGDVSDAVIDEIKSNANVLDVTVVDL